MRNPAVELRLAPPLFPADLGEFGGRIDAVCAELARTAAERDRAGGTAFDQRRLLRESGLLALAVPAALGGAGADWPLVFRGVRRLAQVDSSMAHLFGFQHLQVATVLLFGADEQQQRYLVPTVSERWFWGNAVNARDTRLKVTRVADGWQLDGVKAFCSGARDSDALVVSIAAGPAPTERLYLVLPTAREGITVNDDWDNMGQRQTDSGSVSFHQVRASDAEVLGPPGAASSPRATLRNVIGQIVLTEIYLGNAQGALLSAIDYVRTQVQPWVMAGVERAVDDPMLQKRAGELWAALRAATALSEEANAAFQQAWALGTGLTAAQRGQLSTLVAAARGTAARTALQVTSEIFELMGARATTAGLAHDRYWRNVRVHTVHDPLDYRSKEIGRWLFTGEAPDPYGYG
ncbi:MAG TPA: acyl-CoA dehydrogenase family protein [Ideonella sp.]|nr:acyl-CoA dehydrogenase family protein [Ideonella sp.]